MNRYTFPAIINIGQNAVGIETVFQLMKRIVLMTAGLTRWRKYAGQIKSVGVLVLC
jgi:hypothetical protein